MTRLSLVASTFALVAALLFSAPTASFAQNGGNGGAGNGNCATSITACGNVGQTTVSTSPSGCTVVDDGNVDDPPAPGILSFDGDKDDGQIISQCPQLAPAPVPPPPVTAASCTQAPPSTWYDPQDPTHGIPSIAPAWMGPAQTIASTLFKTLFLFEIFMLGLQALLHRNDITHLFSGLAFKTFVATFFIYLMSFSPTFLPQVFGSFQIAGQSVGSSNGGNLMSMYHQADSAAELFFCAAMASHIDDHETALEYGTFGLPGPLGSGDLGHTFNGAVGHITFEFLVQGLGMLVIAGAGVMFLSLAVITGESYITMFAGVFFIGFSSMRFTLPFTQGYLSYAVNVGVKMFTYWVLIEVESTILMPILLRAGTGLINAASIQFGPGSEMYLVPAAVDVAQIVVMGALTWFLPNITGRFVSGRSGSSTVKMISDLASSLKGRTTSPTSNPSGSMPHGPMRPAQFFRGINGVGHSDERIAATTAPPRAGVPAFAFSEVVAASPIAALSSPLFATTHTSRSNDTPNTDPSKQALQVSVEDGPDPFAITSKPAPPPIMRAPAEKHAERQLAGILTPETHPQNADLLQSIDRITSSQKTKEPGATDESPL